MLVLAVTFGLVRTSVSPAVERAPELERVDEAALAAEVDAQLDAAIGDAGIVAAAPATDAEFLRRASLDLTGSLPTASEARAFLDDPSEDKRSRLIAELVDSPGHARHLARRWTRRMLQETSETTNLDDRLRLEQFFYRRFVERWRYDRLVADFLAARGRADDGPGVYYRSLELKPERLAGSTARIFLGLQLDCAQCHDHPFDRWSQEDFWGYAAFFARLERPSDETMMRETIVLRDRDRGEVRLPETETIIPPRYLGGEPVSVDEGGTRREQLAIWVTARENPYLARAAVNRAWADLFGQGLVEPVDDFRATNPASHPEVLTLLTDDFVRQGFDLGRVYRVLAATKAYQRSSRWTREGDTGDSASVTRLEATALRAVMPVKVLPPEELFDALILTSRGQSGRRIVRETSTGGERNDANDAELARMRQTFLARMERRASSATEYEQGAPQALLLMNGAAIERLIASPSSGLVTALTAPWLDDEAAVEALVLATLTRRPTPSEHAVALSALSEASSGPASASSPPGGRREAMADLLWALINTAEFACVP